MTTETQKEADIVDLKYVKNSGQLLSKDLIFTIMVDDDKEDSDKPCDYSGIYGYYEIQNGVRGHIKNRHKKNKHEKPDYYTIKYHSEFDKCVLLKESDLLYSTVSWLENVSQDYYDDHSLDDDSNKKISKLTSLQKAVMTEYEIDEYLNESNLAGLDKIPNDYVNGINHYLEQSKVYPQIICKFDFDKDTLEISNIISTNKNISNIKCYNYLTNTVKQTKDEYIKQFIDNMDNRCIPQSTKFMDELYTFLNEIVNLPHNIWKIVMDDYLFCHHLDCDIGTFNNHELRFGGSNSWSFTIFVCYKCHFIWQIPEFIGENDNYKYQLLPTNLINKVSIKLPDSKCGWRYYPLGHHFKWKSFDKQDLDSFTYFEYVEKLNERIKNKHTEEKLVIF